MKKSQLRQLIKEIVTTILEDPDGVHWSNPTTGKEYETNYMDVDTVDSVDIFCHYQGKPMFFAYRPADRGIYCSDWALEQKITEAVYQKELHPVFHGSYAAHGQLKGVLSRALNDPVFAGDDATARAYGRENRLIHSRVFKVEDHFIFSCWEKKNVLQKYKSLIDQFMKDLGYTAENMKFEPADFMNRYLSYQEVFGGTEKQASEDSDATLKWKELLHLNPDLKKAVLKLPSNKIEKAAGKMGISVAQLNHLAATFRESLNESTEADRFYWMDPNAKLVPVPRYGHEEWAELFLKQTLQSPKDHDIYGAMDRLRWYRIIFTEYMGKKIVSYDHSRDRPPSSRQLRAIKDLAIELGADEVEAQPF